MWRADITDGSALFPAATAICQQEQRGVNSGPDATPATRWRPTPRACGRPEAHEHRQLSGDP